ncbi:hypothetical protein [Cryobacterium sp. PH31-O1]|uniref:phage terminase small subunit n=1 Tax=Cryobacterium sp. PH31-O1 TaxID=3046306 RepID=UPI0024B9F838|nr:hypothetical protein [Cryobacterium sp. PH31-O1]MDJ0338255.1 hypothetical protein [Cryobacterium sp. PH31-O1]
MAVPGREPTANPVHRNTPQVGWTDVPDKPFSGKRPTLPKTRTVVIDAEPVALPMSPLTVEWWNVVSTMPHCALWTASDWLLAQSTAFLFDVFAAGTHTVAAELRRREQELGTTAEARRKLRIRYVPVEKPAPKPRASRAKAKLAPVANLDSRRQASHRT